MKKTMKAIIIGLMLCLCFQGYAIGFDNEVTHPDITQKAATDGRCNLDSFLKSYLGFQNGRNTKILSGSNHDILWYLKQGSIDEDSPNCRATNHFHNPLLPWNQSQMSDDTTSEAEAIKTYCVSQGWFVSDRKSNVVWATGFLAPPPAPPLDGQRASFSYPSGNYYSPMTWDYVREYFYKALTAKYYLIDNNTLLSQTLLAVGHVLHLLQDTAVAIIKRGSNEI